MQALQILLTYDLHSNNAASIEAFFTSIKTIKRGKRGSITSN
jgi:hypothetical protein